MKIEYHWDKTLDRFLTDIDDVREAVRHATINEVVKISEETKQNLRSLTPGKRLPKQWSKRVTIKREKVRVAIYNRDGRGRRPVELKDGRTTNLLEMLEYGTSFKGPIVPVNKKALKFTINGKEIFTTKVNPVGIKPYGFMRSSTAIAKAKMSALAKVLSKKMVDLRRSRSK